MVWINTVESGEVPLVVYRFSSVNLKYIAPQQSCKNVVVTHVTSGARMQICKGLVKELINYFNYLDEN